MCCLWIVSVWVKRAGDLFASLPGSAAVNPEATPASLPLFAELYPAVCDQCRKWKKSPLISSGENRSGISSFISVLGFFFGLA